MPNWVFYFVVLVGGGLFFVFPNSAGLGASRNIYLILIAFVLKQIHQTLKKKL